ncbi:Replicase polyprotein 1ab [Bienertia sinuspersici]
MPEVRVHGKAFILDCLDFLLQPEKNGEVWLALPDDEYKLLFLKKKICFPDDCYRPQPNTIACWRQMWFSLDPQVVDWSYTIVEGAIKSRKLIFINIVNTLMEKDLLSDGRFVFVTEQVGICLYILTKAHSYQDASDIFQHSISTMCKYNRRDCVGAIYGTHVEAVVGGKYAQPFIGSKGIKTWNVWASCSFDLLFTYVCVRFEGSTHGIV